ncbi:MAG: hypothetical protein NVSMB17_19270 [Candidatus Dormibacteria bacterium]
MSLPPLLDAEIAELIRVALAEDVGSGDISTEATVAKDRTALARIEAKAPGEPIPRPTPPTSHWAG